MKKSIILHNHILSRPANNSNVPEAQVSWLKSIKKKRKMNNVQQ